MHKRFFLQKQQDRSSERNQVALDFTMKASFFYFVSLHLQIWGQNLYQRRITQDLEQNIHQIAAAFRIRLVSTAQVSPRPSFCAPLPQTHYSGSVPGRPTVLFYSQCTIYTLVCDQIANKSSSFVVLNASSLRKYRGKPSLWSASF